MRREAVDYRPQLNAWLRNIFILEDDNAVNESYQSNCLNKYVITIELQETTTDAIVEKAWRVSRDFGNWEHSISRRDSSIIHLIVITVVFFFFIMIRDHV